MNAADSEQKNRREPKADHSPDTDPGRDDSYEEEHFGRSGQQTHHDYASPLVNGQRPRCGEPARDKRYHDKHHNSGDRPIRTDGQR